MTARRVNVTLEETLHDEATSYAEGRGMSFSAFVSRALRDAMHRGETSPSSGQAGVSSADMSGLIRAEVETALRDFLTSDKSDPLFDRLVSKIPVTHAEVSEVSRAPVRAPPVKASNIEITPEFRERLKKFGPTPLMKASGVNKGSISDIQTGKKAGVTSSTFEKLEAGLIALEEEASRNTLIDTV